MTAGSSARSTACRTQFEIPYLYQRGFIRALTVPPQVDYILGILVGSQGRFLEDSGRRSQETRGPGLSDSFYSLPCSKGGFRASRSGARDLQYVINEPDLLKASLPSGLGLPESGDCHSDIRVGVISAPVFPLVTASDNPCCAFTVVVAVWHCVWGLPAGLGR